MEHENETRCRGVEADADEDKDDTEEEREGVNGLVETCALRAGEGVAREGGRCRGGVCADEEGLKAGVEAKRVNGTDGEDEDKENDDSEGADEDEVEDNDEGDAKLTDDPDTR